MNKYLQWAVLTVSLLLVSSVSADQRSATVAGNFNAVDDLLANTQVLKSSEPYQSLARPVRFHGRIAGTGRFNGILNVRRNFAGAPSGDFALLQGAGRILTHTRAGAIPVFATAVKQPGQHRLLRLFVLTSRRTHRSRKGLLLQELRVKLLSVSGELRVAEVQRRRSARHFGEEGFCGLPQFLHLSSKGLDAQHEQINILSLRTATVLLEADSEYAAALGNLSEELSTVFNGVDSFYQRDLGVSLQPVIDNAPHSYVQSISYDENYAIPLHQEMREHHPASSRNTDIHFLMTGKGGEGELINLAGAVPGPEDPFSSELGVLCREPQNAIGFAIRYNTSEDILTTAHEIGHIFGAEHDDNYAPANEPGIMNSGTGSIDGEITKFSDYSKNQIAGYLNNYGSCTGTVDGTEPPDDGDGGEDDTGDGGGDDSDSDDGYVVSLEIWQMRSSPYRARVQIKGEIWDSDDYWISRETVTITCTDENQQVVYQAAKRSTRKGKYKFPVRRPYPGAAPITCQAAAGGALSNALTVEPRLE